MVGSTCRKISYVFFIFWQQSRAAHSCYVFINVLIVNIEGKSPLCITVGLINQNSGMFYYYQL